MILLTSQRISLTDEADRIECAALYLAALKGDWKSVQDKSRIQRILTINNETIFILLLRQTRRNLYIIY